MATWKKDKQIRDNGELVEMIFPEIISASRSTDIPALYADWFFYRLAKGYSAWTNPFNGVKSYISYANTRFIIFWSKNPKPLLNHIETLKRKNIGCYIQYTLNDYESEDLEKNLPNLEERITTFRQLSTILGKDAVIWRFDPLILTNNIDINSLLKKIEYIGEELKGYTEKLVFSFVDINEYSKVINNLKRENINYRLWSEEKMIEFANRLSLLNKKKAWNFELATCAEKMDLSKFGINHNQCIDERLIIKRGWKNKELMKFLHIKIEDTKHSLFPSSIPNEAIWLTDTKYAIIEKNNPDKGQRIHCGCSVSKDIGQYNTCIHHCEYCYANSNKTIAKENFKKHCLDNTNESIIGI